MKIKDYLLLFSILINFCLFFYIFNDVKNKTELSKKIDQYNHKIDSLSNRRVILQHENDSLKKLEDSINSKIYIDRIKIIKIIEYRDKKDTLIKSMADDELLGLFSKFDSLSFKNR